MKIIKSLKIWAIILLVAGQGRGQEQCYEIISKSIDREDLYSEQLIEKACSLKELLDNSNFKEERSQRSAKDFFKVFSKEYYPLSQFKSGVGFVDELKNRFISEMEVKSDYYVGIGKILDQDGLKYEVIIKLPLSGDFHELNEFKIRDLEKNSRDVGQAMFQLTKISHLGEQQILNYIFNFLNNLSFDIQVLEVTDSLKTTEIKTPILNEHWVSRIDAYYLSPAGLPIFLPAGTRIRFSLGNIRVKQKLLNEENLYHTEGVVYNFALPSGQIFSSCANANYDFIGYCSDCRSPEATRYRPNKNPQSINGIHEVVYGSTLPLDCDSSGLTYFSVAKFVYNNSITPQADCNYCGPIIERSQIQSGFEKIIRQRVVNPPMTAMPGYVPHLVTQDYEVFNTFDEVLLPYPCLSQTTHQALNFVLSTKSVWVDSLDDGRKVVMVPWDSDGIYILYALYEENETVYWLYNQWIGWQILEVKDHNYAHELVSNIIEGFRQLSVYTLSATSFVLPFSMGFVGASLLATTLADASVAIALYGLTGDETSLITDLVFVLPLFEIGKFASQFKNSVSAANKSVKSTLETLLSKGSPGELLNQVGKSKSNLKFSDVNIKCPDGTPRKLSDFADILHEKLNFKNKNSAQKSELLSKFADDIAENPKMLGEVVQEPGLVKAWDALFDYPVFRKNIDYLENTDDYLTRTGKTKQNLVDDLEAYEGPKETFLDELYDTPASGTYANNPSGVWNENPFLRGREIEDALGQNLHDNFPWIDKFDPGSGSVTSIKSTDTYAKTYQLADNLEGLWKKYVDDLIGMPPPNTPIVFGGDVVQGYTKQILEIAVPDPLTSGQNSVLNSVINYAKGKGVNGTDVEIIIQVIE